VRPKHTGHAGHAGHAGHTGCAPGTPFKTRGTCSFFTALAGNSDSNNGSNCIYDEMIDELTDADGGNRLEYWKQVLTKREYVYNKAVVVKGTDGREMHQTFKLKTPHHETVRASGIANPPRRALAG
jgi:hypothetical protein